MPFPIAPDDDTAAGLAAKKSNIDEYARASGSLPPQSGRPILKSPDKPSLKDKVNPKGAPYGSRPGEKRIDVSGMTKPLSVYHKGTNFVEKTGPAILERGEAVISKEKNPMAEKSPYGMITKGDAKPPKEIHKIITHKTTDGKYHHQHIHHRPEHHPDEEHVSNTMKEMQDHMQSNDSAMTSAPSPMPPSPPAEGATGPAGAPGGAPSAM